MESLTTANFQSEINSAPVVHVVFGIQDARTTELKQLVAGAKDKVCFVDIDKLPQLAMQFSLTVAPCLLTFKNGEVVFQHYDFSAIKNHVSQ